jgi:hypothetical protein
VSGVKTKFSEYLEGLSSGGRVLETGQNFVVHLAKSREKMATFQVEEPAYCFLKWYQAAVAGGARDVYFEMDVDTYVMVIPFPEEIELGDICSAYEGKQADLCRRDRLFLEGLLASTSAEMETSISTDKESHVMSATGLKKPGWWSRLSAFRQVYKEKSVRLTLRVKYSAAVRTRIVSTIQDRTRFGPIVPYFVINPSRRTFIEEREAPLFSPWLSRSGWYSEYSRNPYLLEVWLGDGNGALFRERTLKRSRPNSKRYPKGMLCDPQERGDVAALLSLRLEGQAQAIPVQEGVTLESIGVGLGCPGLILAFSADGLKTDLSGFKLAENEELTARLMELRESAAEVVEKIVQAVEKLEARELYGLNPAGVLAGSLVGFFFGLSFASDAILVYITLAACLGWILEQLYRRKEHREARKERSRTFQEEVLKRLGVRR